MKITVNILFAFFIISFSTSLYAQETASSSPTSLINKVDTKMYGHLSLGNAIAGGAGISLLDSNGYKQTKAKSPVVILGADYMVNSRFSMGLQAGYQRINVNVADSLGKFLEEGNINRIYAGFRGLLHYGKKERVDLYSGFKLGIVMFSTGEITGPNAKTSLLEKDNNRMRYSLGIIPIGARFLITETVGAHVQISIGAPTFVSAGVNYKFQ